MNVFTQILPDGSKLLLVEPTRKLLNCVAYFRNEMSGVFCSEDLLCVLGELYDEFYDELDEDCLGACVLLANVFAHRVENIECFIEKVNADVPELSLEYNDEKNLFISHAAKVDICCS